MIGKHLSSSRKNNMKLIVAKKQRWLHSPECLINGRISYMVKYLGQQSVAELKGIDVVKRVFRQLYDEHTTSSGGGGSAASKLSKRCLAVSINGVAIQEAKTRNTICEYPLVRISYCADDRAEKRFFSFIATEESNEVHTCFVFISEKLAEEITLTIGQAFDLAYQHFLTKSNTKNSEMHENSKENLFMARIRNVEQENMALRNRLKAVSKLVPESLLKQFCQDNSIDNILAIRTADSNNNGTPSHSNNNTKSELTFGRESDEKIRKNNGDNLDGAIFESIPFQVERSDESKWQTSRTVSHSNDLFGMCAFSTVTGVANPFDTADSQQTNPFDNITGQLDPVTTNISIKDFDPFGLQ